MSYKAAMYDQGVFASRPAASVGDGYMYFATDTGELYHSNGAAWTLIAITTGGGAPSGSAGGVLDGSYPNPGLAAGVAGSGLAETSDVLSVNVDGSTLEISADALRVKDGGIGAVKLGTVNLDDLSDVQAPSPSDEQALTWDAGASKWVPKAAVLQALSDAKGDLVVGTAADTFGRLAVGADGLFLKADSSTSTGFSYAAPGGGNYSLLETITRATDGLITHTSISGSYNDLVIHAWLRSDRASSVDNMYILLNGDTANNHYSNVTQDIYNPAGAFVGGQNDWSGGLTSTVIAAASLGGSVFSFIKITIPGYASTTWQKMVFYEACYQDGSTGNNHVNMARGMFSWPFTTAITQVGLQPQNGTNFKTNSVSRLYGIT